MTLHYLPLNKLFEKYIRGPEHPMKQRIISFIHRCFNYTPIISKTKFPFSMYLDIRDVVQRNIFFNYEWEPNLSNFINNELKETDVFLDIGSNIGYFALLAAHKKSKVYAFDPDPKNVKSIQKNQALNDYTNISTLNMGLSDENSELMFYRAKIENNGLSGYTDRNSNEKFLTSVRTLDSLIYDDKIIPTPTFLKIDTEGWEEKVLKGASRLLSENPPRIIVFESEFLGNNSINDFSTIERFLKQHNYTIVQTLDDQYGTNHVARHQVKVEKQERNISIIIPILNSAKTLTDTLESIEIQDQIVEIIIIDNYSKDESLEIANSFKDKSKHKVKIINNPNINASSSRNIGISAATGDYILFLDSDDMLKRHALTILSNQIEHHDIVFAGWEDFDSKTGKIIQTCTYQTSMSESHLTKYFKYKPTISTALIKKTILVRWDESMKIWEVTRFFLDILSNNPSVTYVPTIVTSIRQHNNPNRLSIKHNHFDPLQTIGFFIESKLRLKNLCKLDSTTEEVIDEEIINYCYTAVKLKSSRKELRSFFKEVNLQLIPKYKNYKWFGIFHFIHLFKGFNGLIYFYSLNRLFKRE